MPQAGVVSLQHVHVDLVEGDTLVDLHRCREEHRSQ